LGSSSGSALSISPVSTGTTGLVGSARATQATASASASRSTVNFIPRPSCPLPFRLSPAPPGLLADGRLGILPRATDIRARLPPSLLPLSLLPLSLAAGLYRGARRR